MNTGKHAFTIVYNYVLAAHEQRGRAAARRPVRAGADAGRRRMRRSASPSSTSSPPQAAADPARAEAAWKFVNFMAGKPYTVAKRWAVEKGLGFGQLPLFDDPDVHRRLGQVDRRQARWASRSAIAKAGTWTEWTLGLVGLFPPAARQGDGRRGERRRDHEGRRRALERAQGEVRQPLSCGIGGRRLGAVRRRHANLEHDRLLHVDHQALPGALAAAGPAAGRR